MSHHAVNERHALTETLRQVAPESQTLCGEWDAAHLAAHLVLRERSVVEMAGRLPSRRLKERAEDVVDDLVAREPYPKLVDAFGRGPSWREVSGPVPTAWLFAIPLVCEQANLLEYLIHHEDVRRAQPGWTARELAPDTVATVWGRLGLLSKLTLRSVSVGLVLRAPGHGEIRNRPARRGAATVTVSGDPVELALFAYGRRQVANVDYDGTPADLAALSGEDISL